MLDPEGDREPDLWISDLQANGSFIRFADVTTLESGQRVSTHRYPSKHKSFV